MAIATLLALTTSVGLAAEAQSRVVWARQIAQLELTVATDVVPSDLPKLAVPVTVYGKDGRRLWANTVQIALQAGKAKPTLLVLQRVKPGAGPFRVEVAFQQASLGLNVRETLRFSDPKAAVLFHGLRREGEFPTEKVSLLLGMNATRDPLVEHAELELVLRDHERNQISKRAQRVPRGRRPATTRLDLTPDAQSVGPYTVEYTLSGEVSFQATERFAYATTLLPVSSMESNELLDWFRSSFGSPRRFGNYNVTINAKDVVEPAVFDAKVWHSGQRALRLDYEKGKPAHVYSNLVLPGFPLRARVWVKGNGSTDKLYATFRDRCEIARWAHERHANRSEALVGSLDFEGWRSFSVPVLGGGLQATTRHENKRAIAVPVYLLAFSVHPASKKDKPGPTPEPRRVWLDDLAVETQVPMKDRLALELRADTRDCRLHGKAVLTACVGNGLPDPIKAGRLGIIARDRAGKVVFEAAKTIDVPAGGFGLVELPLAALAAKQPEGPVDVVATFTSPAAGLRGVQQLVFKNARHQVLLWDFEKAEKYNGFEGGEGASPAAGGAAGSRLALSIPVKPETGNKVILHPSLPGIASHVEMMVAGGPAPVVLRPIFLDEGATGVAGMPYNKFQMPDIRVDWQGWRKISVPCPATSPDYAEPDRMFVFQPDYPLNLVLSARVEGDKPGQVRVDQIVVVTHLAAAAEVAVAIDFPDQTRVHRPGTPLSLAITNFAPTPKRAALRYELRTAQGAVAAAGEKQIELPAARRASHVLGPKLPQGVYTLRVEAVGPQPFTATILATDLRRYFGKQPAVRLADLPAIQQQLRMTGKTVHLDWDNMEMAPGLFHYDWFHNEVAKASVGGAYQVVPIVGFAADWAGPEKQESVAAGGYARFIGNYLQTPVRMRDWSIFVREAAREFQGRFGAWQFWENPDIPDFPAYIPPAKYQEMLTIFARWLRLYDPKAKIVAGGFNFDRASAYLRQFERPDQLPFDRIEVQMNLGELSPEAADLEGALDELGELLKLGETKRSIEVPQLDWSVGEHVSPVQQAAYHARASLIFHRRGAAKHRVALLNIGESYQNYGLLYRAPYGNTPNVQAMRPLYLPKPSLAALVNTREFLVGAKFLHRLRLPDVDPQANRAYVYDTGGGRFAVVLWRSGQGSKTYGLPAAWKQAKATDIFGATLAMKETLTIVDVPTFVQLPASHSYDQLRHEVRTLVPTDGGGKALLSLHLAEADSCRRAGYARTGKTRTERRRGSLLGGEPVDAELVYGLATEKFSFDAEAAGPVILTRLWYCDGKQGQKLSVKLNDGPETIWDLSVPDTEAARRFYVAGMRESNLVLSAVKGANMVAVRYEQPGNSAVYRVEPLVGDSVDLARLGPLNVRQTKGEALKFASAVGSPLTIGKEVYATGLGTHAAAYLEYALNRQFARFEVRVGVDAAAVGKGSVVFKIYVDGKEKASSGVMTGFSPSRLLRVEELADAERLLLRVEDGDDGVQNDLADWVEGKLWVK